MSKRDLSKESYRRAADYARKFPSRISEVREVLLRVRRKFGQLEFEVQSDLYDLLLTTQDRNDQGKILRAYQEGLNDVEQEGRLKLKQAWRADFGDDWVFDVFVDGSHGQIIVVTRSGSEAKTRNGGVYGLRISDGGQAWTYRMKKNWAPWQPYLGHHHLFFTEDYCGNRDSFDPNPYIYSLSLATGEIDWKETLGKDTDVKQLRGVFGSFLLANIHDDQGSTLVAVDSGAGMERWRYPSYCRISGKLFLSLGDVLCAQYRDREIGWFSQRGKLLKKLTLRFPKKDEGFIDLAFADRDTIYVCVWDVWQNWDENTPVESSVQETATVAYAINKESRKVRWSLRPKAVDVRFESVLPHGKKVYFCGENATVVADRETGEVVKEWPFQVLHVAGRLLFRSSRKSRFSDNPFVFYACSAGTAKVRWQRENFDLMTAENGLLVGRVEDELIVLDEKTGKERASFSLTDPRTVQFITKDSFLVVSRGSLRLFKLGGEV